MGKFVLTGGKQLSGTLRVSGAKNSSLPILAASLMADGTSVLEEIPNLNDVQIMFKLLEVLGAKIQYSAEDSKAVIKVDKIHNNTAPYELGSLLRASFLLMGPLLAKNGKARMSLPGGCAIGTRPVDIHIKGFEALGAKIKRDKGYVEASAPRGLKGNYIYFDFPSVGATENLIMAAALAKGQTILENAATEPEIVDLATYLNNMGADVRGAGTDTILIDGVKSLKGTTHAVIPDRIEAGTFMVAAAITGGDVKLENIIPEHLKPVTAKLKEAGIEVSEELTSLRIKSGDNNLKAVDIKTHPYPGFPTDMQAQLTALMSKAHGTSMIVETIFENRFTYVSELKRMGANIRLDGRSAIIQGEKKLSGAQVKATDLRAGAALIIAALAANDVTEISDIHHIERGYVDLEKKLAGIGASISKER